MLRNSETYSLCCPVRAVAQLSTRSLSSSSPGYVRRALLLGGGLAVGGSLSGQPARAFGVRSGIPAPPDVAAPPKDAEFTASGLASKVLKAGTGVASERPGPTDKVTVDYTGWTTDGAASGLVPRFTSQYF